ncbi:hypothetical protein ACAW74_25765 [Fibrella sp. WM1]|uniref:hypothetical protein n=1 Tax=Fibrella musci TaxID=3242485 RepID=UPI003521AFC1
MKTTPKWGFGLVATLLSLASYILIAGCLSGCTSLYNRAKARFQTTHVDTTYQLITVAVPADSTSLVVPTATTPLTQKQTQGRATVTIIREPTNTTVLADCAGAEKDTLVMVKTVTEKWGVDPKYQELAEQYHQQADNNRRRANKFMWIAIGLGLLLLAGLFFLGRYLLRHYYQLQSPFVKRVKPDPNDVPTATNE